MSDDAPPGVPEWVVTYGDMMSLLLTFFIMLVSMSEVASEQKYRSVMEALQQYLGYRSGPSGPPGKSFPLNSLVEALQTLGSFTNTELGRGGVRAQGPEGEHLRVFRHREGERLRVGELLSFSPRSDVLSERTRAGLRAIAKELAGKPNKVEIRAHAEPQAADGPSGALRLSYRRGRAVVGFLERLGIAHERLRITAMGSAEPPPGRGDERRQQCDRVEVLLLDEFAATYIGPRTAPQ